MTALFIHEDGDMYQSRRPVTDEDREAIERGELTVIHYSPTLKCFHEELPDRKRVPVTWRTQ